MKLLLIEDNDKTRAWLEKGLREAGLVVDAVADGRDGLHLALEQDYALIILDRVKGLELGADDYLVKPFSFAELLARVRAQLRRHAPAAATLQVADLTLDTARHAASRGSERIALTRQEFTLLWLLASRVGEILPRTLIASEVWGINFDSETNVVDVAIRRLRKKIDDPFPLKLIETVRGMGYRLNAPEQSDA